MNTKNNDEMLGASLKTAQGQVSIHPDGFGFFNTPEQKGSIFIPKGQMRGVMPEDTLEVTWDENEAKPVGLETKVIARKPRTIAMVKTERGFIPFSKWLVNVKIRQLDPEVLATAQNGDIWLSAFDGKELGGQINVTLNEKVGTKNSPKGWHTAYLVDENHPIGDVNKIAINVSDDAKSRSDWTSIPFVTVDGSTTKDFDDAVFVKKTQTGWEMKVAIADVSAFMSIDTDLDRAAMNRGSTVYLPGDVRPMLPYALSDEACSLLANEVRAVMGVTMVYDEQGKLVGSPVFEQANIKVARRCLYEELEEWSKTGETPKDVSPEVLEVWNQWRDWLKAQELQQDVVFPWSRSEHYIRVNEDFKVECIQLPSTPFASKMVEIAMVSANRAAAQLLSEKHGLGAFRNHQEPDWSRGADALAKLGWENELPPTKEAKPWWKAAFEKYANTPHAWVLAKGWAEIQTKAQYQTANQGHHALAADAYTHFTSPIRRYADLEVHRAIKKALSGEPLDVNRWDKVVGACNDGSKRAKQAERKSRQQWMNMWWEQQPADFEVKAVIKSVRRDGSAMVNTQAFGTSGLLAANQERSWAVGEDVLVKFDKKWGDMVSFTGRENQPKEEIHGKPPTPRMG